MIMPKSHCVELLPNFFSWLRRFWSILRWLEIFWRDEIENFSMNCSNMAYISLFFTISVKFLGIIVITKSAFENVSKIFGWRIFSKYFLTTNWKIKMIFLFSLKILFLFIRKSPEMLWCKMSQHSTIIHIQNFITFVTFLPLDGIKNFLLGNLRWISRRTSDRLERHWAHTSITTGHWTISITFFHIFFRKQFLGNINRIGEFFVLINHLEQTAMIQTKMYASRCWEKRKLILQSNFLSFKI